MPFEFNSLNIDDNVTNPTPYEISEEIYLNYLKVFGDISPLHVDDEFARNLGYEKKIMHGAILNGFLANYNGIYFSGKYGFTVGVNMKYLEPTYLGDKILIEGRIKTKSESTYSVEVLLSLRNLTRSNLAARAVLHVKFIQPKS